LLLCERAGEKQIWSKGIHCFPPISQKSQLTTTIWGPIELLLLSKQATKLFLGQIRFQKKNLEVKESKPTSRDCGKSLLEFFYEMKAM